MFRWFTVFCACTLAIVAAFFCWGIYATVGVERELAEESKSAIAVIGEHAATALDQVTYSADQVAGKVGGVVDAIKAPCAGFHGSVTCGPLAQLSQTEKNIGIVAGQSALQVKQSGKLIDASAASIQDVAGHLNKTADGVTTLLAQMNDAQTGLTPTLGAYRDAGVSLNDLLKRKAIAETIDNVDRLSAAAAGTVENLQGITKDAKIETDAMVAPKTKKQKVMEFAPPAFKLGITLMCFISKTC
jgi:hypothetical protein